MRFTTDALIIREMDIGESDRLVTLLTRQYGVIKAFAGGAKNIKSKKAAATRLLSFSSVTLSEKNGTYRITEATVKNMFFGAGDNVEKLALSQYFCELAGALCPPEDSEEFLRLILNSLHFLTKGDKNPTLIKAVTELRIAAIAGYMPNLVACEKCGEFESDVMYFRFSDGQIFCNKCIDSEVGLVKIDRTILSAMRHIVFSKFEGIYAFSIPDTAAKRLSDISGRYILTQTEQNFNSLNFYNVVKNG